MSERRQHMVVFGVDADIAEAIGAMMRARREVTDSTADKLLLASRIAVLAVDDLSIARGEGTVLGVGRDYCSRAEDFRSRVREEMKAAEA